MIVTVPEEGPLRDRGLIDALPLFAAVALLMAGTGLTGTLLGIRAGLEGFGPLVTGVVLAGYYLGFVAGSWLTPVTIARVGHIRVFSGLASLSSAIVLVHVLRPAPAPWFVLRAMSGLCVSGLYVVIESWLNGAATNQSRGRVLATYMVVLTGGLGLGQVIFSTAGATGFTAFAVASVLVSLAIVPLSLVSVRAPELAEPEPLSLRAVATAAPIAPFAGALAGFSGAAVIGGGTVYAVEAGLGPGGTAGLISGALVGGLLLQVPLGRWSDRTDRRRVIVAGSWLAAAAAVGAALVGPQLLGAVVALTAVAGGMSFPLYSLANAHLNDYLDGATVISAGARMVMVNGMGAVAGPLVGAAGVQSIGPGALFGTVAVAHGAVGAYALWRITRRAPAPEEQRATYAPVPAGSGPTLWLLPEGAEEELYPRTEGMVETEDLRLPYAERGLGDPVLLLGSGDAALEPWEDVLTALAADGLRPIAGAVASTRAALALLHHLELAEATFVGQGAGATVASALAAAHPERVQAVVLVDPPLVDDEVAPPVLVIGDSELRTEDPERFADLVAAFLRHLPAPPTSTTADD